MSGLDDIARTGAPAIVALLGIGTVFLSLTILYLLMRIMDRIVPHLSASAQQAAPVDTAAPVSEYEEAPSSVKEETPSSNDLEVAAAITLALARHRSSRAKPHTEEAGATNSWKMAGRLNALRKR